MKTIIKIFLLIILLTVAASNVFGQSAAYASLIKKVYSTFSLDTSAYKIEVLSDDLSSNFSSDNEIAVKSFYTAEPLGRYTILATVTKNGATIETRQVRLFIHKYADVIVANNRITRLDELNQNSVSIERKDVTELRDRPLTSLESAQGNRAKRNLEKGTIITSGDVELVPVIKSHSDIHIVYVNGYCKVTSLGEALQDGRTGDFIKVKNKSSNKVIIARVIDETAVAVTP